MPVLSQAGLSVATVLVMANEAVVLKINTYNLLTFKEMYKTVNFQTKFDFMAWPSRTASEMLPREATHRSATVSRFLSQHPHVTKWKAKTHTHQSLGKLVTLRFSRAFSQSNKMFSCPLLPSSSKTQEKNHLDPLLQFLGWGYKW